MPFSGSATTRPCGRFTSPETIAAAYLLMARLNSNVPSRFFIIVIKTVLYCNPCDDPWLRSSSSPALGALSRVVKPLWPAMAETAPKSTQLRCA